MLTEIKKYLAELPDSEKLGETFNAKDSKRLEEIHKKAVMGLAGDKMSVAKFLHGLAENSENEGEFFVAALASFRQL